jgi:CHAD domain-containing protein
MPPSLIQQEGLSEGFRRIFAEGFAAALQAVDAPRPSQRGAAVHESRKRLKELRAALRLVRPALGQALFDQENAALRDLGRPLSDVRDAQVMLDALAKLKDHFNEELSSDAFAAVRRALAKRRQKIVRQTVDEAGALANSAQALGAAQRRAADWPLGQLSWGIVVDGLGQIYRQGRSAMAAAHAGDDNALHEWRKRVKDLRYQLTILQPLWPAVLCAMADAAHTLGDRLGDDHDLAVLNGLLSGELHDAAPKHDRQALAALIARRRQTLQKHARQFGQRLFAEKPKEFARRIMAYADAGAE